MSIISTHEPLMFWEHEIKNFPVSPCTVDHFNSRTWGVTPRAVADEGGKLRHSWRCSSLLHAMYLMLYLDQTGDEFKIKKCQAPNCAEYFRVALGDGRSEKRIYCPHPDDPKKQGCASRASSKMDRDRRRGKS